MNNTHEYYEMLISRYKDNDLNDEEIAEMEKHLHECAECRKFKEEIFAMSSILTGKMPIEVNNTKKKFKFVPYIASIAAMLLIFVGIGVVINNNNTASAPIVASTSVSQEQEENVYSEDGYSDYALLSTYFDYAEENQSTEEDSITVLSAYMAYME
ncbi:zf-HC2 domain-containing protein [Brachyspira pilosicoli]|uniref:zf-HC2 domain-containing protein n=1 Tax=Brachyspira pilosicoli TaxID=52584 RepID=UPI000E19727C|nr:zf-HC2 domain-containing protein [Brachyspira pilosicoli]SUW04143.1 Predicted transmembrane transcriptional regulator (anti-sigma factor) [Brachyspira pilosicoli]